MSFVSGLKDRVEDVRERRPLVDHVVRAIEHYGTVKGSALAAAVTYFAFLSFFPILALAFAVFGQVTKVYEDAEDTLVDAASLGLRLWNEHRASAKLPAWEVVALDVADRERHVGASDRTDLTELRLEVQPQ